MKLCFISIDGTGTLLLLCIRQSTSTASPQHKRPRLDPFDELRDCQDRTAGASARRADSAAELAQYKALHVQPAADNNPLTFWRDNAEQFPTMSTTARRVFCISASSAQSERDFSSVGRTVTEMRSRLYADKIEALEILRSGMKLGVL